MERTESLRRVLPQSPLAGAPGPSGNRRAPERGERSPYSSSTLARSGKPWARARSWTSATFVSAIS